MSWQTRAIAIYLRPAADALTPVGMNTCATTRNAPTAIGKLDLPGDLSGGVTPSPGG
jgi:hypothetical protein